MPNASNATILQGSTPDTGTSNQKIPAAAASASIARGLITEPRLGMLLVATVAQARLRTV